MIVREYAKIGGLGKYVHYLAERKDDWGVSLCGVWAGLVRDLNKQGPLCPQCLGVARTQRTWETKS